MSRALKPWHLNHERGLYLRGPVAWRQLKETHSFVAVDMGHGIQTDRKFFKNLSAARELNMEIHLLYTPANPASGQALTIRPHMAAAYPNSNLWIDITSYDKYTNDLVKDIVAGCGEFDVVPGFRFVPNENLILPKSSKLWVVDRHKPDLYDWWEWGSGWVWLGRGGYLVRK